MAVLTGGKFLDQNLMRSASIGNCSLHLSKKSVTRHGTAINARPQTTRLGGGYSQAAVIAMGSGCVRTAGTSAGSPEMVPSELGRRCASADYENVSQDEANYLYVLSLLFHALAGCRGGFQGGA